MLRLKQHLPFPRYATVSWLAWVLGAQLDNDAVARLALMLLLIALSLWAWQTMRSGGARAWGSVALVGFVAAIVAGAPVVGAAVSGKEPAAKTPPPGKGPRQGHAPARVPPVNDP